MLKKLLFIYSLALIPNLGFAHETTQSSYAIGDVHISNPWAKNSAKDAKNAAAYITLLSKTDDELTKAEGYAIADKIELHNHIVDDKGIAQMREVPSIPLKANQEVVLKPRSLHIMLLGLKKPLQAGDKFPLKLTFKKAGTTEVQFEVKDQNSCCNCSH